MMFKYANHTDSLFVSVAVVKYEDRYSIFGSNGTLWEDLHIGGHKSNASETGNHK